jgi:hypothetical protein
MAIEQPLTQFKLYIASVVSTWIGARYTLQNLYPQGMVGLL